MYRLILRIMHAKSTIITLINLSLSLSLFDNSLSMKSKKKLFFILSTLYGQFLYTIIQFFQEHSFDRKLDVPLYDMQGDNKDQVNKEMIESMLKQELSQQEGEETGTGQSEASLPTSIRESPEVTCYTDNEEDKTYE